MKEYDDNLVQNVIDSLSNEDLTKRQIAAVVLATVQLIRKQDVWWIQTTIDMIRASLIDDLSDD